MENKYIPIDCHKYDQLEELAVKKVNCTITYLDENNEYSHIEDKIVDFETKNKEEFLILSNGKSIRLDKVLKINDLILQKNL